MTKLIETDRGSEIQKVVQFPSSQRRHYAEAPQLFCSDSSASDSRVISFSPRSAAKRDKAKYRDGGIPRSRQPLTVDSAKSKASATKRVPPSLSMIEPAVTIPGNIVRTVRTCQAFAKRETTISPGYAAIGAMIDPPEIIGPRLEALRKAIGFETQQEFAKAIGVGKNTYNPWEKGTRPLTFDGACKIKKKYKIPLDYLFHGDYADEIPHKILKKLQDAA